MTSPQAQRVKISDALKIITSGCAALGVHLASSGMSPSGPTNLSITGTQTGTVYDVDLWAHDKITNCAQHAYGVAMIAFLQAHPCAEAHRVLATLTVDGRKAVLSMIIVGFTSSGGGTQGYDTNGQFHDLELANGTGSVNELLREGKRIPNVTGTIPATESLPGHRQDSTAIVLDAWWVAGPTADQDPVLVAAENDLFISDLASLD